jgi:hypothetical protein
MTGLKRTYDVMEEAVCVFFFLLIFLLMNLGVFGRYLFDVSFEWNIELCCYSFVWLTFLGAASGRSMPTSRSSSSTSPRSGGFLSPDAGPSTCSKN